MEHEAHHRFEVSTAAAHILVMLDNVQEQLAAIRKAAEQIAAQQEVSDAAQS